MKVPLTVMALTLCWCFAVHAVEGHKRYVVSHDDVTIDVIDEGNGPLMVLLPSAGRDSEDYDKVAEGLARARLSSSATPTARRGKKHRTYGGDHAA
jgi:hypothetical protein